MTNYNERLDEVLDNYASYYNLQDINRFTKEQMSIEFPRVMTKDEAKQAITSLTKELVAEAKPDRKPPMKMGNPTKESSDLDKMIFAKKKGHNEAIDQFEQNLLKELEEV